MKDKPEIDRPSIPDNIKQGDEIFFTGFEPKWVNRAFVVMGESKEKSLFPCFVIKSIDLPSYDAILGWMPITVWMYNPVVPSTAQIAFHNVIINPPPPFKTSIKLLGPVGDTVESWILKECEITSVNFGTLDWGSNETLEIRLTMKYKTAILEF
jgi:hypothetical protein